MTGGPGPSSDPPAAAALGGRRGAFEFAAYAMAVAGLVAGGIGWMNVRAETTLAEGAIAEAEVVQHARRYTRTDRDGRPTDEAFVIDIRWTAGPADSRAASDLKISDDYARRIGIGEVGRYAKPVVRIAYRPHDANAPVILVDDRRWLARIPGRATLVAAAILTPLGVLGGFVFRRRAPPPQ